MLDVSPVFGINVCISPLSSGDDCVSKPPPVDNVDQDLGQHHAKQSPLPSVRRS